MFPDTKGADILARRGIAEVIGDVRAKLAERLSARLYEESLDDLRGLQERLADEIAFEEDFFARFSQALEELGRAQFQEDFAPLLPRFDKLAQEYFLNRGSVLTLHTLCNTYRDRLLRHVLQRVEEELDLEGEGKPPAPYCCLASGSIGRSEQTFCAEPSYVLIYGDDSAGASVYFATFVYRAIASLESAGLLKSAGNVAALKAVWHGSRKEWREENIADLAANERGRLGELVQRADLRLMHGNAALAEEMMNVVRSMLEFHHGELRENAISPQPASHVRAAANPLPVLRELGKRVAEIPTGLGFFGRLRLERSGRHRGKFDLQELALAPLVNNARMLAIRRGLHQTATIDRIKGLQADGHLSVELTERLLRAYHDFTSLKVRRQLSEGCEEEAPRFINPRDLTEAQVQQLRNGLEAVAGLETITYLSFTEER